MKMRQGFVSNSSSSSFIIGFKKDISEKALAELFKTENPFLKNISKELVRVILDKAEETRLETILENYYVETVEELPAWIRDIIKTSQENKFNLYSGEFEDGNGGDDFETYLCHSEIKHEDDNMLFYNKGY